MYTKLAQILSVDTRNVDGGRGSAPDFAGVAHDAPPCRPPESDPNVSRIRRSSRISVIKIWSPYARR